MLTDGEQTSGCLAIEDMIDPLVRQSITLLWDGTNKIGDGRYRLMLTFSTTSLPTSTSTFFSGEAQCSCGVHCSWGQGLHLA